MFVGLLGTFTNSDAKVRIYFSFFIVCFLFQLSLPFLCFCVEFSSSKNVGNNSGAIPAIWSAVAWCGYILSIVVLSSFLLFEVIFLSLPSTPFGIAAKVYGIYVMSPFRCFSF